MRGYSKFKEGKLFSQRSKSNKDFPFLDQDFDGHGDIYSSKSSNISKNSLENEQKPTNNIYENISIKKKNNDFFQGKKFEGYDHKHDQDQDDEQLHVKNNNNEGEKKKIKRVLKRNFTVSSSSTKTSSFQYQKGISKNNSNDLLERQSSTRSIQDVVKRAFSMKSTSSVNSERYCRIYDQSLHVNEFDHDYDCYVYDDCINGNYKHEDDDECEGRPMSLKKMNNKEGEGVNGKLCVRSKVVRACKRLFNL